MVTEDKRLELQGLIRSRGLRQHEIARQMGMKGETLSRVLRGFYPPPGGLEAFEARCRKAIDDVGTARAKRALGVPV